MNRLSTHCLGVLLVGCVALVGCAPPVDVPQPEYRDVEPSIVEAVEQARQAVLNDPDDAEAWGALGDRLFVHEWFGLASQSYERALERQPDRLEWTYRLGLCCASESDMDGAASQLTKALSMSPDYAPGHVAYAGVLSRTDDLPGSRVAFEKALVIDSSSAHAYAGLAQLSLREQRFEDCVSHSRRAIAISASMREAHLALAQCLLAQGEPELAQQIATKASQLPKVTPRADPLGAPAVPPAGSTGFTDFGRRVEKEGRIDEAIDAYRKAIEINPDYMRAHARLGRLLARKGDLAGAEEHLSAAARLKSTDATTLAQLGLVLKRQGRDDEAIEWLQRAVEIQPHFPRAQFDLGNALSLRGDPAAVDHLELAVAQRSDLHVARARLTALLIENGHAEQAERVMRDGLELHPNEARLHSGLGDALAARGRRSAARGAYRRAVELDPTWPYPKTRLGEL